MKYDRDVDRIIHFMCLMLDDLEKKLADDAAIPLDQKIELISKTDAIKTLADQLKTA